ncbi:MAG: hypothetical protein WAQ27_03765 [Candidatus Microsaccharimonas sp.]
MTQTGTSNFIEGYDIENLSSMIESEGLDYFFQGYISVDRITNPLLRRKVKDYLEAREDLVDFLKSRGVEIED